MSNWFTPSYGDSQMHEVAVATCSVAKGAPTARRKAGGRGDRRATILLEVRGTNSSKKNNSYLCVLRDLLLILCKCLDPGGLFGGVLCDEHVPALLLHIEEPEAVRDGHLAVGVLTVGERLALAALGEERAYDLEAAGDRALLGDDQQVVEEEEVALLGIAARDFLERPFQEELGAVDGKRRA